MKNQTKGSVYPCLTYNDAEAAIKWLCRVFGFTKRLVVPDETGGVLHSELSLGSAVILVGSPRVENKRVSPLELAGLHQMLSLYVPDPDGHHDCAVAEGAEVVQALENTHFGARGYGVRDPEGHCWHFSSYIPGQYWA